MTSRKKETLTAIGAWSAMLLASLLNLLSYHGYPLFTGEVALVAATLVVISIVIGYFHKVSPRLAFIFTAAIVYLGIDLSSSDVRIALALALVTLIAAWWFEKTVLKITLFAFGTVAISQAFTATMIENKPSAVDPSNKSSENLPPVVHILLDSYLGTQGMSEDANFERLRAETISFYTRHNFRLYDGAYSVHSNTANSIPYALSFGNSPLAKSSQRLQHITPPKLDYFDLLNRRGYRISSIHVDFIDYCANQPIANCHSFHRSDLSAMREFPMSTLDRAKTIGITLVSLSRLPAAIYVQAKQLTNFFSDDSSVSVLDETKLFSLASAKDLRSFNRNLRHAQYGHVYFAHLLLPHDPYVFTPECQVKPRSEWQYEMVPGNRVTREAAYRDQVRCAMQLIEGSLTELDKSEAGRRAIVIIHGDHGSRIVDERPLAGHPLPSTHDLAMSYSALFAIRAPGVEPGLIKGRASLDQLLKEFALSGFARSPNTGRQPAEIILATQDWIPKERVRLPNYGLE